MKSDEDRQAETSWPDELVRQETSPQDLSVLPSCLRKTKASLTVSKEWPHGSEGKLVTAGTVTPIVL